MPTITVTEAAAELGISPQRVRALIKAKRLKATAITPRMYLIDSRALDAVRERKRGRPAKPSPAALHNRD